MPQDAQRFLLLLDEHAVADPISAAAVLLMDYVLPSVHVSVNAVVSKAFTSVFDVRLAVIELGVNVPVSISHRLHRTGKCI